MRVFVSYTFRDPAITESVLRSIDAKLKEVASVFIDALHNKWGGQLRVNFELLRCSVLLHLESTGYQSEWVQKEVQTARKKGKKILNTTVVELLNMSKEQITLLLNK